MTKSELYNQLTTLKVQSANILDAMKTEKRELTESEKIILDENTRQIKDLETEVRSYNNTNYTPVMGETQHTEKFSLIRSISDIVNNRSLSEATIELNKAGERSFLRAGLTSKGQIILPLEHRSDILAQTATQGLETIATDKTNLLVGLRANSVVFKAGAQLLTGLVGNVSIPVYSNSSVNWESETGAAVDGAGAFTEIVLSPKRLTGYLDVSKQFLAQDSTDANNMLIRDLNNAIMSKLEYTILQAASGNTVQPAGLFYNVAYTSTGATSWDKLVAMESAVNTNNALMGSMAYVTTPAMLGKFKTTAKATNQAIFLAEGMNVNGYPVYVSSNVASGKVAFGNWNDLVVGQWAGIDLVVDPYSQALNGKIRLVINAYFDVKRRRDASFSYANLT